MFSESMEVVKIPNERVAVLIGKDGETKKEIERKGNVKLKVSKEGDVEINSVNSMDEWKVKEIVKAVGRGFAPEKALKLFNDDYYLKIIDLKDIYESDKEITRYKGRVIGEKGKAKTVIEETSGADICIYGDTIGIIGRIEELALAENAINMLLEGASHSRVYSVLERERRKLRESMTAHMWEEKNG